MLMQSCHLESDLLKVIDTVDQTVEETCHVFADDRLVILDVTSGNYHVHLTNDQKQTVSFNTEEKEVVCNVTLETMLGRLILGSNIELSPEVFEQTKDLDYTFFRYLSSFTTIVILPPFINTMCLQMITADKGTTWTVVKFLYLDYR